MNTFTSFAKFIYNNSQSDAQILQTAFIKVLVFTSDPKWLQLVQAYKEEYIALEVVGFNSTINLLSIIYIRKFLGIFP